MLNLLFQLVLKDLKTRYARLALGFLWAFLSPFLTTVILYLVFSVFLKVQTEGVPFFLYLASATFTWKLFQDSLVSATTSLMDNKNLIRESRFPHYLIPLSIVLSNAVLFLPSLVIVTAMSGIVLKGLPIFVAFLPVVFLLHLVLTAGLAVACSVLYVRSRDLKHILEAVLPFLFYLTPAFYSLEAVRASLSPLLFKVYTLNPFVSMLNLYRMALLKHFSPLPPSGGFLDLGVVLVFGAVFAATAVFVYGKQKNSINDHLAY